MPATDDPILTPAEWAAVSVALQDAGRCGCAAAPADSGRRGLRGLGRLVFGSRRPTPFADPRLEAVRQFVCSSRRRRQPVAELAAPLAEHGFTRAQIDALALLSR
jgi:hypothetical protein